MHVEHLESISCLTTCQILSLYQSSEGKTLDQCYPTDAAMERGEAKGWPVDTDLTSLSCCFDTGLLQQAIAIAQFATNTS